MSDLKAFQEDLKNGMSIEDALRKHQLNFKEVVDELKGHSSYPKQRIPSPFGKYIYYWQNVYHVQRKIDGKHKHFGRYKTLKEAQDKKAELERNGWEE